MIEIRIQVPNEEWAAAFWEWYLDGGGESGFDETLSDRGLGGQGEDYSDWSREDWLIRHSDVPFAGPIP